MKNIILSCFDKLAPVIKKGICGQPPWLTDKLKKAMNIHDMLLCKSRKTKSASDIFDISDISWNVIKKLYPSNRTKPSPPMFQIGSVITSDALTISNCSYFSTTVISFKKKIFPLRNCTWFFRVKESAKTDCQFKFETVSSQQVCKQLTLLK